MIFQSNDHDDACFKSNREMFLMKMRKTFYDLSKQIIERKKLMLPSKKRYPVKPVLLSAGAAVFIAALAFYYTSKAEDPVAVAGKGYRLVSLESQSQEYRDASNFAMGVIASYSKGGNSDMEKFCLVNDDCGREDFSGMLLKMEAIKGGKPEIGKIYRYSGWDDSYKIEIKSLQDKMVFNIKKIKNMGMGITSIE